MTRSTIAPAMMKVPDKLHFSAMPAAASEKSLLGRDGLISREAEANIAAGRRRRRILGAGEKLSA
ncbi:hypothetical protein [Granulicella sp. dw_53]|uniref:hypothetical protein n=1 Tax=Granulicella sp. dw_53 TaxID=2719792 RepID=UPI001BD3EC60|nr:hypothetical protein [Granulicella sp. dw_53]